MDPALNARLVKSLALSHGFQHCGIARAVPLDEDARRLENWLNKGYNGTMAYMANHFELRVDPIKLVPGARSVVTLTKNYYPPARQNPDAPQISKYAYGKDYHEVIRASLNNMLAELRSNLGEIAGRGFVDSAPVLERSWAVRSGLGWIGKNGNMIQPGAGSFFFIATLITDLELEADDPFVRDLCGTCNRCVEACPTEAILPDKTVRGDKCISYFTIELKDQLIPENVKGKFENWAFGCDICQDVCPWNRFSKPHNESSFQMIDFIEHADREDWLNLTEEKFREVFRHSPIRRPKFSGMVRNLKFLFPEEQSGANSSHE